jgi:hypothetical protein
VHLVGCLIEVKLAESVLVGLVLAFGGLTRFESFCIVIGVSVPPRSTQRGSCGTMRLSICFGGFESVESGDEDVIPAAAATESLCQ